MAIITDIINLIILGIPLVACYKSLEGFVNGLKRRKQEHVPVSYFILMTVIAVAAFAFAYYLFSKTK